LQKQGYTPCMWENTTLTDVIVILIKWRRELQWSLDATLNCYRDAALDWCWDATLDCYWDAAFVETQLLEHRDRIRCFEARMQALLCSGPVSGSGPKSLRIFGYECPHVLLRLDLDSHRKLRLLRTALSFMPLIKAITEPINRLRVP